MHWLKAFVDFTALSLKRIKISTFEYPLSKLSWDTGLEGTFSLILGHMN